jgi:hypothetical protein
MVGRYAGPLQHDYPASGTSRSRGCRSNTGPRICVMWGLLLAGGVLRGAYLSKKCSLTRIPLSSLVKVGKKPEGGFYEFGHQT